MLPGVFDLELVDALRRAYLPLLGAVEERERLAQPARPRTQDRVAMWQGDVKQGMGQRKREVGDRYNVHVPWIPPFTDARIYENPTVLRFLDQYWGSEAYRITNHTSNCPCRGATPQPWVSAPVLRAPYYRVVPRKELRKSSDEWCAAPGQPDPRRGARHGAAPEPRHR